MLVMEIYGWLSVLFARITGKLTLISPPLHCATEEIGGYQIDQLGG
ncbi:hypothetical protein Hdeb2414_s0013g00411111 [Helianthus debilis subsp. tardiflorus]